MSKNAEALKRLRAKHITNSDDTIKPSGGVKLVKIDKLGRETIRIGKNALSVVAKARAVQQGGEFVGFVSQNIYGRSYVSGDVYTVTVASSKDLIDTGDNPTTLYLLNLDGVTFDDHYIPLYNEDGSLNRDIVLARCNGNSVAIGDDFTGIVVNDADSNGVIGSKRYVKYFFDKGKGTGTITHVAIMPGKGTVADTKYTGAILWKCACKGLETSAYAPPNTPGVTEANEIMIFNAYNGVAGYKINLDTEGEYEIKSSLTADAIGWDGSTVRYATLLFDTNKLAVIDGTNAKVLQINGDGTTTVLKTVTFSYGTTGHKGIFIHDGYLWFSSGNTSTTAARYIKMNMSDWSTESITNANLTILGGLPASWAYNSTVVKAYNNGKYYVYNLIDNTMIVCTDLSNIAGSIVGTYNVDCFGFDVINTETKSDIFITQKVSSYGDGTLDNVKVYNDLANNTYSTVSTYNKQLIWISDGLYANYWTLYELSSPMEKLEDEALNLEYSLGNKD